ncbi:MAG: hypothetical protein ACRD3S_19400 [Terracidiphilus sp.]
MRIRVWKPAGRVLALLIAAALPAVAAAQAAPSSIGAGTIPSRWDIFMGYSYLQPRGTVNTFNPDADHTPVTASYDAVTLGGIGSVAYYFNRYFGVQGEISLHEWGVQCCSSNIGTKQNDDGFTTFGGGVIFRYPMDKITVFAHLLGDAELIGGPYFEPNKLGPGVTVGGGMDYQTHWMHRRLAIRIFQADYEYMHDDWGNVPYGGVASINAARLSTGIVIHTGKLAPPAGITLTAEAQPETVFPGDPVTITATPGGLNPKDHVVYDWSGEGVTGSGTTAKVDTTNMAPGEYNVKVTAREGKPGKEGKEPWEMATATAGITVKAYEPPTVSCTANPTTIYPDGTSTVTTTAVSPQNRPLTYSYSATGGTVAGTGTTAEYSPAGAPTGQVDITCNVSDDKGHTASAKTSLTIIAKPVPPAPKSQALCSISFTNDPKRPMRVDNEAKACLDQVALDLKQQTDAKLVVVGEQSTDEAAKTARQEKFAAKHKHATVDRFAAQRAVNAKDYLVTEQGIDASRISVATGSADSQTVENYLVPPGATFTNDVTGTTPADESEMKPQARKPLPEKHAAKKKSAAH